MKNPTTTKNLKNTIPVEETKNLRTTFAGPVFYLDDLEEHGGDADSEWYVVCCGRAVAVRWQRKSGHLLLACPTCRLLVARFALARRPLVQKAGAAIDAGDTP